MTVTHTMSLGEAAKATGKSKTTISRAVKSGKVSGGNKGNDGEYQIDPAELFRVYPMKKQTQQGDGNSNGHMERDATPSRDPAFQAQIDTLNRLIDEKDKNYTLLLEEKDNAIERLEDDKKRWQNEYNEAKQKLLTFEKVEEPEDTRGWFKKMIGAKG